MFSLDLLLDATIIVMALAVVLWLVSILIKDVSIVDAFWSLMIMLAGCVYFYQVATTPDYVVHERHIVVLVLLALWAIRLSLHIAMRNRGHEEDSRYQQIRQNNEPGFTYKSLYIVFLLQASLALVVSLPLLSAFNNPADVSFLDYAALALWSIGIFFEVVADMQLMKFKSRPENKGKVLDSGLWKYSRHPNYFGEFCIWWAFFLFALAGGEFWSIISPLLMSLLLLKVSGVSLLESTIKQRRPGYQQYCERTSAFFPWMPASAASVSDKDPSQFHGGQ